MCQPCHCALKTVFSQLTGEAHNLFLDWIKSPSQPHPPGRSRWIRGLLSVSLWTVCVTKVSKQRVKCFSPRPKRKARRPFEGPLASFPFNWGETLRLRFAAASSVVALFKVKEPNAAALPRGGFKSFMSLRWKMCAGLRCFLLLYLETANLQRKVKWNMLCWRAQHTPATTDSSPQVISSSMALNHCMEMHFLFFFNFFFAFFILFFCWTFIHLLKKMSWQFKGKITAKNCRLKTVMVLSDTNVSWKQLLSSIHTLHVYCKSCKTNQA